MIDGTFELQISKEIVPDLETAKIDDLRTCDFIFSSFIEPQLVKPSFNKLFCMDLLLDLHQIIEL